MSKKIEYLQGIMIGLVVVAIIATIATYQYTVKIDKETDRLKAENYITQGQYDEAIEFLESRTYTDYDRNLLVYAKAKKAEEEGETPDVIYELLKEITSSDGNLSEEMSQMWADYGVKYNDYMWALKEKEEQEAAAARQKEINRQKQLLKNKIPYEGMDSDFINYTAAGTYDDVTTKTTTTKGRQKTTYKYIWYDDSGKYIVLIAEAYYGTVSNVIQYYKDTFWTSDGMPNFSATYTPKYSTSKKQYSSSSNNNKNSSSYSYGKGSYDVDDYDSPEDFADDAWGDEFDDWDDAYEYWEDNY